MKVFFLGFKEDLFIFLNKILKKDFYFLYFYNPVVLFLADITSGAYLMLVIQLISLSMYYDVLIHKCRKQDQSYFDKSFISEKTIWFEL